MMANISNCQLCTYLIKSKRLLTNDDGNCLVAVINIQVMIPEHGFSLLYKLSANFLIICQVELHRASLSRSRFVGQTAHQEYTIFLGSFLLRSPVQHRTTDKKR